MSHHQKRATLIQFKCTYLNLYLTMHILLMLVQATPTLISSFGPSLLRESLLGPNSDLRVLVLGGERCPTGSVLRSWKADGNRTRLINIYGVTEVSCWASWYEVTEDDLQLSQTDVSLIIYPVLTRSYILFCFQWLHTVGWVARRESNL